MFLRKINTRNFFFRKKDLFNTLSLTSLTIRSCCNCIISNKTCCISNNFKKCVKCVQFNCNYNLTISLILIKQIYKEQIRLKKEVRNARTKLSRLKKTTKFFKE